MKRSTAALIAVATALSACGGGTATAPAILPSASAGYATAANTMQAQNQGVSFVNGPTLIAFAPGDAHLAKGTITVGNAVANDGRIEVTVDGTSFVLAETTNPVGQVLSYSGPDATKTRFLTMFPMASEQFVALNHIALNDTASGSRLIGYSAMGFATNPATIAARGQNPSSPSAFASYSGSSFANVYKDSGFLKSNNGSLFVAVDFVNSSFFGSMDLDQSTTYGPMNLWFVDGKINGRMMAASVGVNDPTQLGMQANAQPASSLTGSFFGANAQNIAGQFTLSGQSADATPQNVVVQGGFIGK